MKIAISGLPNNPWWGNGIIGYKDNPAMKDGIIPKQDLLTLEELDKVCSVFIEMGINKLRITGGEPLVRKNVMSLFKNLGQFIAKKKLAELTLTTNGSQLDKYAEDLFKSGVRRINISLDSLDQNKFKKITINAAVNINAILKSRVAIKIIQNIINLLANL